MISKEGGDFRLYCDKCNNYETGFSQWQDIIDFKKEKNNGWGSRKEKNGDWMDLCPECIGKWNNDKYGINKKTENFSKQEVQKNFSNPVIKGWELLKGIDEERIKLGQKIRLVVSDNASSSMQNSGEIFMYNGMSFVSIDTKEKIEQQMSLIIFGISNFEYIV